MSTQNHKGGVRENIMPHIVTACFAALQRDRKDDSEEDGSETEDAKSSCGMN